MKITYSVEELVTQRLNSFESGLPHNTDVFYTISTRNSITFTPKKTLILSVSEEGNYCDILNNRQEIREFSFAEYISSLKTKHDDFLSSPLWAELIPSIEIRKNYKKLHQRFRNKFLEQYDLHPEIETATFDSKQQNFTTNQSLSSLVLGVNAMVNGGMKLLHHNSEIYPPNPEGQRRLALRPSTKSFRK